MNNLIINGIKRLENSIREVRRDYSPEQLVKINDFVSSYDEMTLQLFNDCINNAAYIISRKLGSNNYLDTLTFLDDDTIQLLDFIEYRAEQKINLEYFNSYFESKNTRFYDDEIEFKSHYLTMEIDEQLQNLILKLEKDRLNCDLNSMLTNDNIKLNPDIICSSEENTYLEEFKNYIHKLLHSCPDYTYNEIKYQKFVDWLGEKRGFEQFGTEWCFWHLMLCKVIACIIPAFFFGSQFLIVGALVAFAYNAMFWVKLKPFGQYLSSPTNFGEFIHGWFIMSALL